MTPEITKLNVVAVVVEARNVPPLANVNGMAGENSRVAPEAIVARNTSRVPNFKTKFWLAPVLQKIKVLTCVSAAGAV